MKSNKNYFNKLILLLVVMISLLLLTSCTHNSDYSGKATETNLDSQRGESDNNVGIAQQNPDIGEESIENPPPEMIDDPFTIQTDANLLEIPLNKKFTENQIIEVDWKGKGIYGLLITGSVKLKDNGIVRVVVDNKYLALESYDLIEESDSISFDNFCQETCVLDNLSITELEIQVVNATFQLDKITYLDKEHLPELVFDLGFKTYTEFLKQSQEKIIVNNINNNLETNNYWWRGGVTDFSLLRYDEKRKMFPGNPFLPNLNGFGYYTYGVFSLEPPSEHPNYVEEEEEGEIIEEVAYQPDSTDNFITGNVINKNFNNPILETIMFSSGVGSQSNIHRSYDFYESSVEFEPYYDMEITEIKINVTDCQDNCGGKIGGCNSFCFFNAAIYEQGKKLSEIKEQRSDAQFQGILSNKTSLEKGKKYVIQLNMYSTDAFFDIYTAGGETPKKRINGAYNLILAKGLNEDYFSRGPIAFSLIGELFAKCYDSDGGKNYNLQGYVKGVGNPIIYDHCTSYGSKTEYLAEMSCDANNNYLITKKNCVYGCENGACRTKEPLPKSFDWRNVHGENWLTPVKNQGYAGTCWAFAEIGTMESQIMLYYNTPLAIDLSEQRRIDCNGMNPEGTYTPADECTIKGFGGMSMRFCSSKFVGYVDEACDKYVARVENNNAACTFNNVCSDYSGRLWRNSDFKEYYLTRNPYPISIKGKQLYNSDELKKAIIMDGPMDSILGAWNHAIVLVGYSKYSDWKTTEYCLAKDEFCFNNKCIPQKCNSSINMPMTSCINEQDSLGNWVGVQYNYVCHQFNTFGLWKYTTSFCPNQGVCDNNLCSPSFNFVLRKGQLQCADPSPGWSLFSAVKEYSPNEGDSYWIFKNSWGTGWGENGYGKIDTSLENLYLASKPIGPFIPPTNHAYWPSGFTNKISCVDKDFDNYCNWGISEQKPSNCPSNCLSEKDCDDSNPNLGAYDSYFNCIAI